MSTRGLIGFRYNDTDKLIYNHSDSRPDVLGLKILRELRDVDNWDVVRERTESLVAVPETRKLDDCSSMAETEIRRYFPDFEHKSEPKNYYDLYRPLQGTLKPYLEGKLMFMPDASDFICNSLYCDWAYIVNLDTNHFEVWKGQQTKLNPENRYGKEADRMGYYPCIRIEGYDLKHLPEPGRYLSDYLFFRELTGGDR
jgi:hypothetical protein